MRETFQSGVINVTVGQRWMYPFENGTDTVIVEIIGKGRSYYGGNHPITKCLQVTASGKDVLVKQNWRVGDEVTDTSIGMSNSKWILLEGQDNPDG